MIDPVPMPANTDVIYSQPRRAETGFDFDDLVDIVNPLQHVPLVCTAYRAITGDKIEGPARLAGGALFGGVLGFLGSLGAIAFEGITGESIEGNLLALFNGETGNDPYSGQRAYASAKALID